MTSSTASPSQTAQERPEAPDISPKTVARPDAIGDARQIVLHMIIFTVAALIVCSRRPDAVRNAQFWAEDGANWYADAYNLGLRSLWMSQAGYLHTLARLIALLALLVPCSFAPLLINLSAIVVQVLPANVFLSSRFSNLAFSRRLLASFVYLGLPNTFEINANLATIQWHMVLLARLVLLAQPPKHWGWRVLDGIVLVLISLEGPTGALLAPVAAFLWWKRRQRWQLAPLAALAPGEAIQALTVLLNWHARYPHHLNLAGDVVVNGGPNGATYSRFFRILGRQVFLPSLLGTHGWLVHSRAIHAAEAIMTLLGVTVLVYALRRGPLELKLFVGFAFTVFAMALARPIAGPPSHPQWWYLCIRGVGNRYYFLPMLAFLSSLWWLASRSVSPRWLRNAAVVLLLLLPIGICEDWRYPPFVDYHFQKYAEQFGCAPSGTEVTIPINPDWSMKLTKR